MRLDDLDARWHELTEEVTSGMKEWRLQHPKATFREIEAALDERLARLRAHMLEDAALLSRATELESATTAERLTCPECHVPLHARGVQTRTLVTQHDQTIPLERQYAVCPECHKGFFPPR